jgi:hypothetical protein
MGAVHQVPWHPKVYEWQPDTQFATHLPPGPVDPGQQAFGLRPTQTRRLDHALNIGPPEFLTAGLLPTPPNITTVARVTPLYTVAAIVQGVAIFGTAGGRAVIP